jgi:hypothetical protein
VAAKKQKPIVRESTSGYGGGEIELYRLSDGIGDEEADGFTSRL